MSTFSKENHQVVQVQRAAQGLQPGHFGCQIVVDRIRVAANDRQAVRMLVQGAVIAQDGQGAEE